MIRRCGALKKRNAPSDYVRPFDAESLSREKPGLLLSRGEGMVRDMHLPFRVLVPAYRQTNGQLLAGACEVKIIFLAKIN